MLLWISACDWELGHGVNVKYLHTFARMGRTRSARRPTAWRSVCVRVHNEGQNICSTSVTFHRVTAIAKGAERRAWDDVATIHRETTNCKASRGRRSVKSCERHSEKPTYNRVIYSPGMTLRWWYDSPRQESCFWPSSGWDSRGRGEMKYHFIQLLFLKLTGRNNETHFCFLCYW